MAKRKNAAFDLTESQLAGTHADITDYAGLGQWLSREVTTALELRGNVAADIDYAWTLYEMGRTRGTNTPWPDAADLTSPFAAEYVDALHARAMQTIFTEPIWTIEGWGESASRAPILEEFHQRTAEQERLQSVLDRVLLRAFVEPAGVLEISENVTFRRERVRKRVKVQTDETTGQPMMGPDMQPQVQTDPETGEPVEAGEQDGDQATAVAEFDSVQPERSGPAYDVIPYLEFLTLPYHAKDAPQVWGYAKRLFRRVPELKARANQGVYDPDAVTRVGESDERQTNYPPEEPQKPILTTQIGPTAQKELWDVQFLADLDGNGERWYRATIHRYSSTLLRLRFDDRTTRYFKFVPFPKPGSTDGYSLITNKLITVIEEDTAVRNMRADKAALAISAPIKKLQGSLWDEYEQPVGPRSVITVRDMKEIEPMQFEDVPQSIHIWKQDVRVDADRLIGQNDTSLGVETNQQRTLGEIRLRAGYAEVRMDLIIKRLKEPLEELGQARHNIYQRMLADQPDGMPMPQTVIMGLEARGVDTKSIFADGRITAELLDGQWWFKPRGSVDSADPQVQQAYFNQFLAVLPALMKTNQMVAAIMQEPAAAKSLLEQAMRVFHWEDRQSILGPNADQVIQQIMTQRALQAAQAQIQQDPRFQMAMALAHGGVPGGQLPAPAQGAMPGLPPQAPMPPGGAPNMPMPGGVQ